MATIHNIILLLFSCLLLLSQQAHSKKQLTTVCNLDNAQQCIGRFSSWEHGSMIFNTCNQKIHIQFVCYKKGLPPTATANWYQSFSLDTWVPTSSNRNVTTFLPTNAIMFNSIGCDALPTYPTTTASDLAMVGSVIGEDNISSSCTEMCIQRYAPQPRTSSDSYPVQLVNICNRNVIVQVACADRNWKFYYRNIEMQQWNPKLDPVLGAPNAHPNNVINVSNYFPNACIEAWAMATTNA
ncbi:predicted protein [Naegleria gruberi]|uniref:Predicted protein n=1 Tax=Naegleria gruberi TaxID=5762 RepID=D2W366_NAEGR|nr:uncharacterized protein NAEGRDRAFT_75837 [Naegleria gruberi]EFC36433.1 predicted protein [Naegleria gruberi]|eukprot:XP_002669177.1 predicted protein [Naegleria gruberi strain NEG-M]